MNIDLFEVKMYLMFKGRKQMDFPSLAIDLISPSYGVNAI
jgi:hypothetical protein